VRRRAIYPTIEPVGELDEGTTGDPETEDAMRTPDGGRQQGGIRARTTVPTVGGSEPGLKDELRAILFYVQRDAEDLRLKSRYSPSIVSLLKARADQMEADDQATGCVWRPRPRAPSHARIEAILDSLKTSPAVAEEAIVEAAHDQIARTSHGGFCDCAFVVPVPSAFYDRIETLLRRRLPGIEIERAQKEGYEGDVMRLLFRWVRRSS
jgi:hypothetical protein